MRYLIKYIAHAEFVGTDAFIGSLEEAVKIAADGLKKYNAEIAAVMDEADMNGEPKAPANA
jgi:hypothetical protein